MSETKTKAVIEQLSEVFVDLNNYKEGVKETIADILEKHDPQMSKEDTASIKKVSKALADEKLDKLKDDTKRLAEMMGSLT